MQQIESNTNTNKVSIKNSTAYEFDKRIYITESLYKNNSNETIDSILIRLMKTEKEKH